MDHIHSKVREEPIHQEMNLIRKVAIYYPFKKT